jgi:hypothetical protein
MGEATRIDSEKIRAYNATHYRLGHTDHDIVLNIGVYAGRLSALFASSSVNCGAFLTAFNPCGNIQSDALNEQAHAQLKQQLQAIGLHCIEGSGSEQGTKWPAERSYFALGLELQAAKDIGRHFDQDAIVWVGPNAIPQLVLLR